MSGSGGQRMMCTAQQREAGLGAAASRVVLQHPAAAAAGATQAACTHLRGPPPVRRSQRSSSRHRRQHRLQRVAASAIGESARCTLQGAAQLAAHAVGPLFAGASRPPRAGVSRRGSPRLMVQPLHSSWPPEAPDLAAQWSRPPTSHVADVALCRLPVVSVVLGAGGRGSRHFGGRARRIGRKQDGFAGQNGCPPGVATHRLPTSSPVASRLSRLESCRFPKCTLCMQVIWQDGWGNRELARALAAAGVAVCAAPSARSARAPQRLGGTCGNAVRTWCSAVACWYDADDTQKLSFAHPLDPASTNTERRAGCCQLPPPRPMSSLSAAQLCGARPFHVPHQHAAVRMRAIKQPEAF